MYCEFFQLTERPFNVTPDPKFLYLNARYREALASLNYGITQRKGFITLIGEAGTGKTTLLNKLLEDLDPKTKSVFIFNTNVTFEEILEYIFAEFDLPVHNGKKLYMLQRLNAFLLDELRAGSNVALLIDEAQDLEFSVLEDLRLLSNLETAKEKILQIVLSGQPELGQKLSNPVLRQLRQRIGINCRLLPLSRDEITEYIQYRLQAAGCPDAKLFSREAEEQIYHFSRGIPRLVNVVCDNALLIGYALGKKRIGGEVINEAAADLLSNEHPPEEVHSRPAAGPIIGIRSSGVVSRWGSRFSVIALLVVALTVGLLSARRSMFEKSAAPATSRALQAPKLEVIRPGSQPRVAGVEAPVPRPADRVNAAAQAIPGRVTADDSQPPAKAVAVAERAAQGDTALGARAAGDGAGVAAAQAEPVLPAPKDVGPGSAPSDADTDRGELPQARRLGEHPPLGSLAARPPAAAEVAHPVEAPPLLVARADEAFPKVDSAMPKRREAKAHKVLAKEGGGKSGQDEDDDGSFEPDRRPRLDGMQFAQVMVHGGDSISEIVVRKYGQATSTILDLVHLANPELKGANTLTTGQTIRLPELGETPPVLSDGSGRHSLLVYSTRLATRASALKTALRDRGFDARVTEGREGQKPVFRVVVSGDAGRGELAAVGKQLQKLFREDTRIAQLGE